MSRDGHGYLVRMVGGSFARAPYDLSDVLGARRDQRFRGPVTTSALCGMLGRLAQKFFLAKWCPRA